MKKQNYYTPVVFFSLLIVLSMAFFLLPSKDLLAGERRKLEPFQTYSQKMEQEGKDYGLKEYFAYLETYMLDQFPARDSFRSIKALFQKYGFLQRDNNGYYRAGDYLARFDGEINTQAVKLSVETINRLYEKTLKKIGGETFFALIPDKNCYLAEEYGYPHYDYHEFEKLIRDKLSAEIPLLNLQEVLTKEAYYKTDPHWDQVHLLPIADTLLAFMDNPQRASNYTWTLHRLSPFYGAYYGQAALPQKPDVMTYLTGEAINGANVFSQEPGEATGIYSEVDFDNVDPYDVFMGGALPLLRVINPSSSTERKLILIRDSFGSSMTPLLACAYSEILLVDIRYMPSDHLQGYLQEWKGADVLFLYVTSVLNTYGSLQ